MRCALLLFFLLAPGCAERPDVSALGPPPPGTDFPRLLTTDEIARMDSAADPAEAAANEALLARGRALQARAARIGE